MKLLRRVTAQFPHAVIDRERGDRMVRDHADRLDDLSAHSVVLDDCRAIEGRVAYVIIRGEEGGPGFAFFILPDPGLIEIDYERPEDRAECRPLLQALAEALEYDIVTEDLDD